MSRRNNLPPGPGPGRPKGVPNKATRDIREFAQKCLEDPEYVRKLVIRLQQGKAPQIEAALYQYAYGKPKDTVELTGPNGGPLQAIEWRIVDPSTREEQG